MKRLFLCTFFCDNRSAGLLNVDRSPLQCFEEDSSFQLNADSQRREQAVPGNYKDAPAYADMQSHGERISRDSRVVSFLICVCVCVCV